MRYILATNDPAEPDDLVSRLLAAAGEEGKEAIVTAADQLIERGRQQGSRDVLLDQLRERFGALPDAAVARVTAASMTELRQWTRRVLTAAALDEVLDG